MRSQVSDARKCTVPAAAKSNPNDVRETEEPAFMLVLPATLDEPLRSQSSEETARIYEGVC